MKLLNFFHNGQEGEFSYFTLAHFAPIIIMGILIYLIIRYKEEIKESRFENNIRMTMAFVMIISEMSFYWLKMNPLSGPVPPNLAEHLPITVCGWAGILGTFLLLTKNQTLFDINYFWIFAGSVNALITPGVIMSNGPGRFAYYQFWIGHTMLFISMTYMIAIHGMRPSWRSFVKSYIALLTLTAVAIWVNLHIEGANYLFLSGTIDGASLLDILPSNLALRVLIMASLGVVLFFVVYLPWYIKDNKLKKIETVFTN